MSVLRPKSEASSYQTLIDYMRGHQFARVIFYGTIWVGLLFLALYRLTDYPMTWFDEGAHLHVPKALVKFGVYADYSSEGFRYYGPTNGVGPTVLLPIAGVFKLFGIGLLQARLVMAIYLLAAIYLFYRLGVHLGGTRLAWVATLLFVASRGISVIEYGRQVLGEVPALLFLLAGLLLWWRCWEEPHWLRLVVTGILLGLSAVTKSQFLLFLGPTLMLAWLTNLFYYRLLPQRIFIIPGLITGILFAVWQGILLFGLDPQAELGNLAQLNQATGSAAFVFSLSLIKRSLSELLSIRGYFGLVGVGLLYGFALVLPKRIDAQKWCVLWLLAATNLLWYVLASVSWLRYAFAGLSLACLFMARFTADLTGEPRIRFHEVWQSLKQGGGVPSDVALRGTVIAVIVFLISGSFALNLSEVVSPPENAPFLMASYLDQNVPKEVLIETFEPEMGFLTDHRYHYPPHIYLNKAIQYKWLEGPLPGEDYDFVLKEKPEYVLVGEFATWVDFYAISGLDEYYSLVTTIGQYRLYRLNHRG